MEGVKDGVDRGRECEAAGRAGRGGRGVGAQSVQGVLPSYYYVFITNVSIT